MSAEGTARNAEVVTRVMRPEEFEMMRHLFASAFGGDSQIRVLLDYIHESWAWDGDLCFVAELAGRLDGHVLYTHADLDTPSRLVDLLVLSPVGVLPDHQNGGIGSRTIADSLARLAQRSEPWVFLEGSPRYYPRFGFRRASDLGFRTPSTRVPPDAFMAYRLPEYETWMTGGRSSTRAPSGGLTHSACVTRVEWRIHQIDHPPT